MDSETFSKERIEAALLSQDFCVFQEMGSLVMYTKNVFPPIDLVLDWSRGEYEWRDLQKQLEFEGVNTQIFYQNLCELV